MSQLSLDFSDERPPDEWVTGLVVDRSGTAKYAHLARAPGDPERTPRGARRDGPDPDGRDRGAAWRRKLVGTKPEDHEEPIVGLLSDGAPRTFNAIGVELYDKTADLLFETPVDAALWCLVERGVLEHTLRVPVLFRLRRLREAAPLAHED
jgi:hypothetical protein